MHRGLRHSANAISSTSGPQQYRCDGSKEDILIMVLTIDQTWIQGDGKDYSDSIEVKATSCR